MSFMVDGGTNNRPRFETLPEASAVANEVLAKTGIVLGVFEDKRPADSTYVRKNKS